MNTECRVDIPCNCSFNSPFNLLPEEILLKIFGCLPTSELVKFFRVTFLTRRVAADYSLFEVENQALNLWNGHIQEIVTNHLKLGGEESGQRSEFLIKLHKFQQIEGHLGWDGLQQKYEVFKLGLKEISFHNLLAINFNSLSLLNAPLTYKKIEIELKKSWKEKIEGSLVEEGYFELSCTAIEDDNFCIFLDVLSDVKFIPSLSIRTNLPPHQIQMLAKAIHSDTEKRSLEIETLSINMDHPLSVTILAILIQAIANNKSIKNLNFHDCMLTNEGVVCLSKILGQGSQIKSLSLNYSISTDIGLRELMNFLSKSHNVKELTLDQCGDRELVILFENLNSTGLEKLLLNKGCLGEEAISALETWVLTNKTLFALDIRACIYNVSPSVIEHMMEKINLNQKINSG